jgi:hypothetical protein
MKNFLLPLTLSLAALSTASADTYAIYSRSTAGTRVSSFSATILRIPAEYASKKYAANFYVVRNLTGNKEAFIESFVLNRKKYYYVQQTQPGIHATTRFTAPAASVKFDKTSGVTPGDFTQFILSKATAATPTQFLADASRPYAERDRLRTLQFDSAVAPAIGTVNLTINDQYALQGPGANVRLPKTATILPSVPTTLTGTGMNCQIHALVDESANLLDYQSSEVICMNFSEKWKLNVSLSDASNGGNAVPLGVQTLQPNTDAFAVYQVIKTLEKAGYESIE